MKRLSHKDGSWQKVQDQWAKQCRDHDEDFESYMPVTLPTLAEQIDICQGQKWTGVFGYQDGGGEFEAVCWLNGAYLPKFSGRVLRVRHLTLSPKYDFGAYTADLYAKLLTDVFESVLDVSNSTLECPHLKFHFRSPADLALFREFATDLNKSSRFSKVEMTGSWLFVNKC